jgi:hypothetical protein
MKKEIRYCKTQTLMVTNMYSAYYDFAQGLGQRCNLDTGVRM